MVRGIDIFRDEFKDFTESYVLIGGAACDWLMHDNGLNFRATRDLDIILVVEALNDAFIERFWEFIKKGRYQIQEKGEGKAIFYRFSNPEDQQFPDQLEFFSRKPDLKGLKEISNLTPIPAEDELSSLSAILMEEGYYELTCQHSKIVHGIHLATIEILICLKARAYIDLKRRKQEGERIDSNNIKKHRSDILRLAVMLTEENNLILPDRIKKDMFLFTKDITENQPNMKQILKSMGIPSNAVSLKQALELLNKVYGLNQ